MSLLKNAEAVYDTARNKAIKEDDVENDLEHHERVLIPLLGYADFLRTTVEGWKPDKELPENEDTLREILLKTGCQKLLPGNLFACTFLALGVLPSEVAIDEVCEELLQETDASEESKQIVSGLQDIGKDVYVEVTGEGYSESRLQQVLTTSLKDTRESLPDHITGDTPVDAAQLAEEFDQQLIRPLGLHKRH